MGKLVPGMPYFIASHLFSECDYCETHVAVPSLGSRQSLREVEGWARQFDDPDVLVQMDHYVTKNGDLTIWYQQPDFYRMEVGMGDTLYLFWDDTVAYSIIQDLKKATTLTVEDTLSMIPKGVALYAEIHHKDHPWRTISYWYEVRILGDSRTFKRQSVGYDLYPIEFMELNGEKVDSFLWRE